MKVTLNSYELWQAAQVGLVRAYDSYIKNNKDIWFENRTWAAMVAVNVQGAIGEVAVAKALNLFFNGSFGVYKLSPDLSTKDIKIEVRHSGEKKETCSVREGDDPESVIIFSTGGGPDIEILGWIYAGKAKTDAHKKTKANGETWYAFPIGDLVNIETLIKIIRGR